MAYAYSLAAWVDAHTSLLNSISAGTGAGATAIMVDASDDLLVAFDLDLAASAVDGDGNLTVVIAPTPPDAVASGNAARLIVRDTDAEPVISMPCKQGTALEAGYCVLNTLGVTAGSPVELRSLTIPAGEVI